MVTALRRYAQTATTDGAWSPLTACGGGAACTGMVLRAAEADGSTGGAKQSRTITASGQLGAQFRGTITSDTVTYLDAGDWVTRLMIPSGDGNGAVYLDEIYVCLYTGGTVSTLASVTGLRRLLPAASSGTNYTFTETLTQSTGVDVSAASWTILWSWIFSAESYPQSFKFRPNKWLNTPIITAREEGVVAVSLSGSTPVPGTSIAGVSKSPPVATLSGSTPLPGTGVSGVSKSPPTATLSGATQSIVVSAGPISVAPPVTALLAGQAVPGTVFGGVAPAVPATGLSGATLVPGVSVGGMSSSVAATGLVTGVLPAVPSSGPISVAVGVAGIDAIVVRPGHDGPLGGFASPACRIVSSGIEVGASVASMVSASRFAGSAAAIGASSSSTLAASRFSWSGQRLGAIPYGALVAGRAFSSEQRLAAIVSPDPVVSRSIQTSAVQGGVGSSGVVAAAISSSGVEVGGVSCAY